MLKLILNELTKIIHRTSFIVMLIVTILFVLLTNIIYKFGYDENGDYKEVIDYNEELTFYKEQMNTDYYEDKIYYETEYESLSLKLKYGIDSWQAYFINNYEFNELLENKIKSKYEDITYDIDKYNLYLERFNNDDCMSFISEEIEYTESEINALESEIKSNNIEDKIHIINNEIRSLKYDLEVLKLRKEYNISYGNDYLNNAVYSYRNALTGLDNEDKYNEIKKELEVNKYIIVNKENINKVNDTRGILKNFFNEYGVILILIIIVLTSSIVIDEYKKGTIKQLLITPYKRHELLISKILTIFIVLILSIIFILLLQLIVGGIFFGFKSLSIPVVFYDVKNSLIVKYSIFKYLLLYLVGIIPMYIILILFMLLMSSLFNNNAITSIFTLVIYIAYPVINLFYYIFDIVKLSFTMHFDLTPFLFYESTTFKLSTSILTCLIYIIIFLVVIFYIFTKKDIKNVE